MAVIGPAPSLSRSFQQRDDDYCINAGRKSAQVAATKMANDPLICTMLAETVTGRTPERRKRQRLAAQWPLRIWGGAEDALVARTVNVSSDGLYCLLSQHFSPGEVLKALLEISGSASDEEPRQIALSCEIQVLRVERSPDSNTWGVAFRILNYSVLRAETAEIDGNQNEQPLAF